MLFNIPKAFYEKAALKNIAKVTGKHLSWSKIAECIFDRWMDFFVKIVNGSTMFAKSFIIDIATNFFKKH